jgi:hypothetical protein
MLPSDLRTGIGLVRLRRWADGRYAVSTTDRGDGSTSLVEGDRGRYAHIVHVEGERFVEVTRAPFFARRGLGASTAVLASDGRGVLRRCHLREYPDGTRREDRAELVDSQVRRSSHWRFPDGSRADSYERDGDRVVEFRNEEGELTSTRITQFTSLGFGAYRATTEERDGGGVFVKSTTSTGNPIPSASGTSQGWVFIVESEKGNKKTIETTAQRQEGKTLAVVKDEFTATDEGRVGWEETGASVAGSWKTEQWVEQSGASVSVGETKNTFSPEGFKSSTVVQTNDGQGNQTSRGHSSCSHRIVSRSDADVRSTA